MKRTTAIAFAVGSVFLIGILGLALGGWTIVDSTEHCVLTRYGKVVERKMDTGLNFTPFTEATCFSMTEQNFPSGNVDRETMEAQTRDPVTVIGDVALVYAYDPATIYDVFVEKRSSDAVETEIRNAIREGYRNALSGLDGSGDFLRAPPRPRGLDAQSTSSAKSATGRESSRCSCGTSRSRSRSSVSASPRRSRRRSWTGRRSSS